MATASLQQQPPSLTFPRPIFAAVSPHPFLQAHLSANKKIPVRANGRSAYEFRRSGINTGSLTHANGSAVVRLGNTSVVCGVRAEILMEEDVPGTNDFPPPRTDGEDEEDDTQEIDTLRLIVPNIELSTGSTPSHIPGNAPSTFQQSLITRIRSLLLSTRLLRAADLRILYKPSSNPEDPDEEPETIVKAYWVLYIDVFFISIDGSEFDAAFLSILAALRDTRLPYAYFDEEYEGILCSDAPSEAKRLRLRGLPIPSTFAVFEGKSEDAGEQDFEWVLSDPDAFEEGVCRESVCVVVDGSRGDVVVRRIEKSGGGVVGREHLRGVVGMAGKRWSEVEKALSGSG
ncbi:exoribonuclease family protein [Setomelanomma holmii]|uniref:Ribosomal RNA-processing protein 43 n=1 Tax=Setomelanomma holmii TaxID=210430 RepID=A0A9P4HJG4_9PLEO|nr:exoribonuclease family protein [Setomelanomma holmii]